MPPIRKGDGTGLAPKGIAEVRKGDGTVIYSGEPASEVSRYAFEQDVTDSWGTNDLTDQTSAGYVPGFSPTGSYAKDFDGVDDYAHADSALIPSTSGNPFSVAFWFNFGDVSSAQRLINQNDNENGFRVFFNAASSVLNFTFENSGLLTTLSFSYSTTGSNEFVCLTRDGSDNATLYRNDANQVDTATGASGSDPIPTTFGAYDTAGTQEYFDGALDLVDIYSKELSAAEVSNLYNMGSIDGL